MAPAITTDGKGSRDTILRTGRAILAQQGIARRVATSEGAAVVDRVRQRAAVWRDIKALKVIAGFERDGEFSTALGLIDKFLADFGEYGDFGFKSRRQKLQTVLTLIERASDHAKKGLEIDAVLAFEKAVAIYPRLANQHAQYGEMRVRLEKVAMTDGTLAHEKKVTALINGLVDLAVEEKDHATEIFLQWFVTEQIEEEESANDILSQLELAGDVGSGLFMIDKELGARVFTPPAATAE